MLASGGEDRCVRLWQYPSLTPFALLGKEGDGVNSAAFNHANTLVCYILLFFHLHYHIIMYVDSWQHVQG